MTESLVGALPDYDPPDGLVDSVMRTVRAELRPGRPVALDVADGFGYATDTAIAAALRAVLDGDPTIAVHRCAVTPEGRSVRVTLRIAAAYLGYGPRGDEPVRASVVDTLSALFDLVPVAVDIHVADVLVAGEPA